MDTIANRPYWRLHFDASGRLLQPPAADVLGEIGGTGIRDLFVFSHGWGSSEQHAEALYQTMFPLIADAAAGKLDNFAFAGVFWPSIWFPDPPSKAAPQVAAAVAAGNPGVADAALTGAQLAEAIKPAFPASVHADISTLGALIDQGLAGAGTVPDEIQAANLDTFHSLLAKTVTSSADAVEDNGETALFQSTTPREDYAKLAGIMGSVPPGGDEQGLGDIFHKVWNGAKDGMRVFSFFEMKARAGTVGERGLGPLLEQLHAAAPTVRVHLIGHSFGARLCSFALKGISSAEASPVASLFLVQGAFSHWSFAQAKDMPWGQPGALCGYGDRVRGPLLSTFSRYDYAVGTWYPKAAFLAQDMVQDKTDPTSRWGGMGADGFQASLPSADMVLQPDVAPGTLQAGTFHRVDCNAVITDTSGSSFSGAHSDIEKPEIAELAVAAATS